jgi:hypothetical protein
MATFDTPRPISATIEIDLGEVHVVAGERTDTVVVVNPSDPSRQLDIEAAAETKVELLDDRLLVRVPKPRGLGSFIGMSRRGSVDLKIDLPEGSAIEAKAGFADIRADGRLGNVRIKDGAGDVVLDETGRAEVATGAGRLTIEHVDGQAELTTAGEMRIGSVAGDASVKNQSGKTWIGEVAGRLQVRSANGDIAVGRVAADVTAKTANGSIEVGEVATGIAVLETAAGGIDVGIRPDTAAWVDASTKFGHVHNSLGPTEGPGASRSTVEVRARTSFGVIAIHRSHV